MATVLILGVSGAGKSSLDTTLHVRTAMTVLEGDGGKGIGLTGAMNVALAAAYRTNAMFTSDRHFRRIRPLTGHTALLLLPDDM